MLNGLWVLLPLYDFPLVPVEPLGLSVTVWSQHACFPIRKHCMTLRNDLKRSSNVKSKGCIELTGYGFLLVSHCNFCSICDRLTIVHARDRQTDGRQTVWCDIVRKIPSDMKCRFHSKASCAKGTKLKVDNCLPLDRAWKDLSFYTNFKMFFFYLCHQTVTQTHFCNRDLLRVLWKHVCGLSSQGQVHLESWCLIIWTFTAVQLSTPRASLRNRSCF